MYKLIRVGLIAPLALFSLAAFSADENCVDSDGDGWGWNGTGSCLVGSSDGSCVDDDGDGWGWNGSESCRVGLSTGDPASGDDSALLCVDDDGDGWGWNGVNSCRAGASSVSPEPASESDCVDEDGDGWGWGPSGSCVVAGSSAEPAADQSQPTGPTTSGRLNSPADIVAAHFDHGPDPDDGHAAAAAYVVRQELNLNMVVVGGTTGVYSAGRYLPQSEDLMRQIWGQQWLDAHNSRVASAEQAARRWVNALSSGGDVWVAEGGPSDFTAAVVRIIRNQYPEFNTRRRVHVVQHSQWNEDHALRDDLNFVRNNTDYIRIADGNDPNSTADLRQDGNSSVSQAFVQTARASRYRSVWDHAFNYLSPDDKLDFSDTVELLYILGIGTNDIRDVTDFGRYFMSR